jgi:hypothetical protein
MGKMVFELCATSFNDPASLKSAGFIDLVAFADGQNLQPPGGSGFVSACHGQGMGALFNNSNDSGGGCSSGCDAYYSGLANLGLDAVGGESETGSEMNTIMEYLTFMDYGGSGTGGPTGNNDVWAKSGGNAGAVIGKYSASCFLEPYVGSSPTSAEEVGQEAALNKDAGCFEVGILVTNYNIGQTTDMMVGYVDAAAAQGVTIVGFQDWYVQGDGSEWSSNPGGSVISGLMSEYGTNMTNISDRRGGVTPSPTPTPGPTPGAAPNTNLCVRVRTYQPGQE